jgi:hypothetical protein
MTVEKSLIQRWFRENSGRTVGADVADDAGWLEGDLDDGTARGARHRDMGEDTAPLGKPLAGAFHSDAYGLFAATTSEVKNGLHFQHREVLET